MIVVRVELHSAVNGRVTELARAYICNIGGTAQLGDYDVRTLRGRSKADLDENVVQRRAQVIGHARLREHVWNLVAKALVGMGYGAKAPAQERAQAEPSELPDLRSAAGPAARPRAGDGA
jgi:hypothetical protein